MLIVIIVSHCSRPQGNVPPAAVQGRDPPRGRRARYEELFAHDSNITSMSNVSHCSLQSNSLPPPRRARGRARVPPRGRLAEAEVEEGEAATTATMSRESEPAEPAGRPRRRGRRRRRRPPARKRNLRRNRPRTPARKRSLGRRRRASLRQKMRHM